MFAADEYYLMTGRPFPEPEEYEGFVQHENGIGMARTFRSEVEAAAKVARSRAPAPAPGFFAWVDGAPAEGYRAPRRLTVVDERSTATPAPTRTVLLTGEYGARVLAPLVPTLTRLAGTPVEIRPVPTRSSAGTSP